MSTSPALYVTLIEWDSRGSIVCISSQNPDTDEFAVTDCIFATKPFKDELQAQAEKNIVMNVLRAGGANVIDC